MGLRGGGAAPSCPPARWSGARSIPSLGLGAGRVSRGTFWGEQWRGGARGSPSLVGACGQLVSGRRAGTAGPPPATGGCSAQQAPGTAPSPPPQCPGCSMGTVYFWRFLIRPALPAGFSFRFGRPGPQEARAWGCLQPSLAPRSSPCRRGGSHGRCRTAAWPAAPPRFVASAASP